MKYIKLSRTALTSFWLFHRFNMKLTAFYIYHFKNFINKQSYKK